jgi:glycosyltransferase involved in cell wall biosynthesis
MSGARPLRTLHVHSGNMFGGVERILETLASAGGASGLESAFALCFEGRLSAGLERSGAALTLLPQVRISRPWQVLKARQALKARLERPRPDLVVVHSAWSHTVFGPTIRRAGIPLVRWLHAAENGRTWQERAAGFVRPDFVICNSRYTCEGSSTRYPGVARGVFYAPVPVEEVEPEVRARLRKSFDAPADAIVIVMAARMEALKGHATLLAALSRLRSARPWGCWIAGGAQRPPEVEYVEALQAEIDRLGLSSRVKLLGERPDVSALLAAADIYCQPNIGPDAYGLSFVEALVSGLPVVSTTLGAVGEVVDASCGILVPPHAPEQVASALESLFDNETRRAMSVAALARGAQFTDVDARVEALAELLAPVHHTALQ